MSHNTWIHRVARIMVRPIVDSPIRPNHITTLRLVVGLGAAMAFARGDDSALNWGAGLFAISMVLDRADGELARQTGKTSPFGHKYDLFSDTFCNALAFVGIGIGLRAGQFGSWSLLMGIAAGLSVALILWLVLKLESGGGERAGELPSAGGFDADDAMLVVPLAIWFGGAEWLLLAAAIGAPLFAILMLLIFRRRRAIQIEQLPVERS